MMRVVISGGSGLIGRRLVAALAADGRQPVVLSRRPERVSGLPEGAELRRWDGESAAQLKPLVDGATAVVHLAGESIAGGRWTAERKRRIRGSRVRSSAAVAEALRTASAGPRVLVQASAVGYYGPRGDEEIGEDSAPGDDFLAKVCREWEGASAGVEQAGVRRALARTGVVLSTEGGALPPMALPFRLFAGGPVGGGDQWLPWIHIDDQVAALRFLLDTPAASGPFNLTAPNPLTNREFSRALGKALRRPSLLPTPAFALRLALGEMSTLVLTGQRALPRRLLEHGFTFRYPEAAGALQDLLG